MPKYVIMYKSQQKQENKGREFTARDDREANMKAHDIMRDRPEAQKIWVKKISESINKSELISRLLNVNYQFITN